MTFRDFLKFSQHPSIRAVVKVSTCKTLYGETAFWPMERLTVLSFILAGRCAVWWILMSPELKWAGQMESWITYRKFCSCSWLYWLSLLSFLEALVSTGCSTCSDKFYYFRVSSPSAWESTSISPKSSSPEKSTTTNKSKEHWPETAKSLKNLEGFSTFSATKLGP